MEVIKDCLIFVLMKKDINIFALLGFIFSFVSAVIGLVFGIIGLNKCKEDNERGEGLAKAAIIISTVSIVLSIIAVIVYIILLFSGIITMFSLVPHPVVQWVNILMNILLLN